MQKITGSEASASPKDRAFEKGMDKTKALLPRKENILKHTNLPHISMQGYYQFVTFRTYDSIDDYLLKLQNSGESNSVKQQKIDSYLDNSKNGAYLFEDVLMELKRYILSQDKEIFDLVAFSIMPNHIHILFQEKIALDETIRVLKGGSSFVLNKLLNKKGSFWAKDYYDKLIRNEQHFEIVYKYIKYNALKANLKDADTRFYGVYG
jgi:REP element-mobilizing transposase RayT